MPTPLTRLLQSLQPHEGGLAIEIPDDWAQGRTVFGGLQAALALRAMRSLVPTAPLRTLQATFMTPVSGRVELHARILRSGKNASHVEARVMAGADTAALIIGVFGEARASLARVTPLQPAVEALSALQLQYMPGVVPNFLQHFEGKLLRGSLPFAGTPVTESVYELRLHDDGPVGEEHLIAMADYPPPLALCHLKIPAPGSTLTWMLELMSPRLEPQPSGTFRVDVKLTAARDGYTSQSVVLWGPDGAPLALGQQSMLVFG